MKFEKGHVPWNKGLKSHVPRCPDCSGFLGSVPHKCRNVDLKGDRFCLDCGKKLKNTGYERYRNICPKCEKIKWRIKETILRIQLILQFGGKCETCGYNKYYECLEFHDLDEKLKHKKHFLKLIVKHPERFKLLCNRCHRELHLLTIKGD